MCHSFSSKEQAFFNFMAAVIVLSDFGAWENKVCHCFHCFTIYLPWSYGTGCHFLNVEFKPDFSPSSNFRLCKLIAPMISWILGESLPIADTLINSAGTCYDSTFQGPTLFISSANFLEYPLGVMRESESVSLSVVSDSLWPHRL